ncbi:CARDB domain-containing protein, partial [Nostoc sp. NIES-2111]
SFTHQGEILVNQSTQQKAGLYNSVSIASDGTINFQQSQNQALKSNSRDLSYGSLASINTRNYKDISTGSSSSYLSSQEDSSQVVSQSLKTSSISLPDLIIQSATVPGAATIGSTIQLNYTVKNQGSANAFASYTYFYLSKDKFVSDNDFYLGADYVDSLAAGAFSSESIT